MSDQAQHVHQQGDTPMREDVMWFKAHTRGAIPVGWLAERNEAAEAAGLVLYRIDRDTGGWRLFAKGTPAEGMANGTAIPVLSGYSACAFGHGRPKWFSPDGDDIARAALLLARLMRAREQTEVSQ